MILNPSNYQFEPFDLEKALAGKPLAATFDNNGTITYKLVEQFYRESSDFALYKVLIESTYYTFNSDGVGTVLVGEGASAEEVDSQLWMCKGIIDPARPSTTDEVIETGPEGDTQPFYLPSLNFRETVALQALNAIIGHYDNPIGYNAASIKLMITKAFEFAGEFVNQAVKLRVENASEEGGEYIVEDPPEIAALKDIRTGINEMKDDLRSALYMEVGTDTFSITQKVAAVADAVTTGDANIVSALGTTNTRLGAIASNTSDTNDKLDVANGKLAEIDSNTENIEVSVSFDDSGIIDALIGGTNKQSVADAVLYIDNYSELQSIDGHVANIDSKIPNPNS